MHDTHLAAQDWTLMAIESLKQRGRVADWREFARALTKSDLLAARATPREVCLGRRAE
jgi:hypothetical protein